MSDNNNLVLWDKYKDTNMDYTKPYDVDGETLTTIRAMYQVHRATKEWGSMGKCWGVKDSNFKSIEIGRIEDGKNLTILLMCEYTATLFYPDGLILITSSKQMTFKGSVDPDYSKKCATEALSWGLARLGFSADIYMQKYDKSKTNNSSKKGLQSYTAKDKNKKTVDPLDGPSVEPEDISDVKSGNTSKENVSRKSVSKKVAGEKVIPEIDKKFEKAMKDQGYSEAKIKEHLGNSKINKMIKQQVINNKLDLAKK